MSYLIDTCAFSELVKKTPNPKVVAWFRQTPESTLYMSVITLGEIKKGISKLEGSAKKKQLTRWLESDLIDRFEGRILDVTAKIALTWGTLLAEGETQGQSLPAIDSLLAATAISHDLILVTRNTKDMQRCPVKVLDLW